MFEAAIFDWDGTLGDTRKVIVKAFQQTLREIKCDIKDEFIARRMGIGAAETFREILRVSKRPFDEKLIQQLVARKSKVEIDCTGGVRLFPGAISL